MYLLGSSAEAGFSCIRRWFPAAAAALLLVAATPTRSQAQDGAPTLGEPEAPSTLRPGRPARVEAPATRVEACQLRVRDAAVGTVDPGRAETIAWTWTVPDDAGSEPWSGSVAWSEADDVGRERPDVESRPFTIEVDGAPGGRSLLIEPGSLAVGVSDEETDARPWLERAADWGQLGTLAATIVAVAFAWFQIRGAKRQARSQRTGEVFDRLNNRDFHIRWSKILTFLKLEGEEECLMRIRREVRVPTGNDPLLPTEGSDSVVLNDIQAALGVFEEAALLFNDHTLEQDTVIRAFGDSIADAYLSSWWWVHYQRECRDRSIAARWVRKREATAYFEWERMVRTMIDESPASRADFEAAWEPSPVRAICLPLDDEAKAGEWARAGRLSAVVGRVLRRRQGDRDLEDFLPPQFAPRRTIEEPFTPVDRTVLIPPWPELFTLPSGPRRAAVRVGAWWDQRQEEHGGSPTGYRLVRLDPWVVTCQRYQEIAWRLEICRRRVGDADLTRRLDEAFPESDGRSGAGIEPTDRGAATTYRF